MLEHSRSLIVSGCCNRSYKPCQHHLSPCFKQHVISFWRYLCDDTVTSAETDSLSFWVHALYPFMYHSSMFDSQSFHLYNCVFIYLPVVLRSCFTTTILKVRCAPLPDAVVKTPRLQKTTKLHNIMYIWITVHTWTFIYVSVILTSCFIPICLTESMLFIYSLYNTTTLNVRCFTLWNTVVEMICLLETTNTENHTCYQY